MNKVVRVSSGSVYGISVLDVVIETAVSYGQLPQFLIVGLPDKAVEEAKERVRCAIKTNGFSLAPGKIVVNLTPANTPKQGTQFDLGITLGILASQGDIEPPLKNFLYVGELSLDGNIRPIRGALPFVLHAKEHGFSGIVFPKENLDEVASIQGIDLFPVTTLSQVITTLCGSLQAKATPPIPFVAGKQIIHTDFADVHGQHIAKRALEIAAAGGHNILLSGVPGAGKTMMARAFVGILPPLQENEAIELTKIYSVSSTLEAGGFISNRPFRSPHHTTSMIGLIGGGSKPKPGEISLAHRGVLFLDEFAEFPRQVLESLRQPLEDGLVSIARASGSITYPSRFTLLAAVNPCPCGYLGSKKKSCVCTSLHIERYKKRLSGPILDRIDLHVYVSEVETQALAQKTGTGESSEKIRSRVIKARTIQEKRLHSHGIVTNAELSSKLVKNLCTVSQEAQDLLLRAVDTMALSTRTYFKMIKIAQTIADLEGSEHIEVGHVQEALSYRPQ